MWYTLSVRNCEEMTLILSWKVVSCCNVSLGDRSDIHVQAVKKYTLTTAFCSLLLSDNTSFVAVFLVHLWITTINQSVCRILGNIVWWYFAFLLILNYNLHTNLEKNIILFLPFGHASIMFKLYLITQLSSNNSIWQTGNVDFKVQMLIWILCWGLQILSWP